MRAMGRMAVAVALLAGAQARAQTVVKLGTLAPHGSAWHEILKDLSRSWSELSSGTVTLRVYAGGVQGGEGDMIRKLRIGQLQAAALSNVGLHDVTPEPKGLSVPLLFAGEDEAECVFDAVRPGLEAALARQGLVVLHWSRIGALHLFCSSPRRSPAEMADTRFFAQEGDEDAANAWRSAGFRPVQLAATDLYMGLQTGMVECVPSLPLYVLTARLFEKARYMNDLPWGFMYGATVIRQDVWDRIPAELRGPLAAAAREGGHAADGSVQRLNEDALTAMRARGLQVLPVDPAPWRVAMARSYPELRGRVVPAEFFDALLGARDRCRAAGGRR